MRARPSCPAKEQVPWLWQVADCAAWRTMAQRTSVTLLALRQEHVPTGVQQSPGQPLLLAEVVAFSSFSPRGTNLRQWLLGVASGSQGQAADTTVREEEPDRFLIPDSICRVAQLAKCYSHQPVVRHSCCFLLWKPFIAVSRADGSVDSSKGIQCHRSAASSRTGSKPHRHRRSDSFGEAAEGGMPNDKEAKGTGKEDVCSRC